MRPDAPRPLSSRENAAAGAVLVGALLLGCALRVASLVAAVAVVYYTVRWLAA